ncbi:hypothetical protein ILUMI_00114 [Ignelater luminosus]|uniref:Uncharacterized protein n=1 Tax=Ignelater luminosus TaxID=2038154 RepID=A0A8K0DMH8_IGNLU|nr:hypothetical protein ILUMI_00114 [Ignelater luminosus]
MGARISKRGSYNLKKREKESRRNRLEGRTSSVINLTLSQIYEDELKTPKLDNYGKHKNFGNIYENQNALNGNEAIVNTIQNINDRSDSERDDYSNPDDEKIYENIIHESNSNFEEQIERKEERKRRKTWSQSETHDGDKYYGMRNSISEASERSNEQWEEILNGGFWKNENDSALAEQIEVKEDKSEEQVEVVVNDQESKNSDIKQHENKVEQILDDPQNLYNEEQVEVLSENESYEQIEVIADVEQNNFQEPVKIPTEVKPENTLNQNWEFENKIEEITQSFDNASTQKEIVESIEKNIQVEETESVILLHLEEKTKSDTEHNNKDTQNSVQNINELKDINIQQNEEINNSQQVEEHNIRDSFVEKDEINEKSQGYKQLSKTVSSTSDAFYEIASEGWIEDSEYEEFYDAEDFQTQIEVDDKELKVDPNKGVLDTTIKAEEKLNHTSVLETKDTSEVVDMKSQTELESSIISRKESNRVPEELLIDINYLNSEADNFVSETKEELLLNVTSNTTNLSENTHDSTVKNETSLIQKNENVEITHEQSYNKSQPSSILINFNEGSRPVEPPNLQLELLESSNSDLSTEHINLESSGNEKNVVVQADLLIDLNEEISSVKKITDHLKGPTHLELNNKFQEDVESDRKDSFENQFVPLVDTNIQDKKDEMQSVKTENISNAIHAEYIDEHKSSKTEDLQEELNYKNTDTINKLENSLIFENEYNEDHLQEFPSVITGEDVAKDQMKVWEKQEDEKDEKTILKINAIINNINQVKLQIDNLGSTEKDQEIHTEIYQTLIKLMRDVNNINNYKFDEEIIKLQNIALSEVHSCLRNLQMKNI